MTWAPKDPNSIEYYFVVWCSKDGTNDGSKNDNGELQGATISTVTWTVPTGLTKVTQSQDAILIHGITYPINTVAAVKLSGGSADTDYEIICRITTSDGRTLDRTNTLRVRDL